MSSSHLAAVDSWRRLWARGTQPTPGNPSGPGRAPAYHKRNRLKSGSKSIKTKKPPKYRRTSTPTPIPPALHQLDLHKQDQSAADVEEFGDPFNPPSSTIICICFQNLNNLPPSRLISKSRQGVDFILQSSAGIFALPKLVSTGLKFLKTIAGTNVPSVSSARSTANLPSIPPSLLTPIFINTAVVALSPPIQPRIV